MERVVRVAFIIGEEIKRIDIVKWERMANCLNFQSSKVIRANRDGRNLIPTIGRTANHMHIHLEQKRIEPSRNETK